MAWAKANRSLHPCAKSMNFVLANNLEHDKKTKSEVVE